jgi:hypothetical protein
LYFLTIKDQALRFNLHLILNERNFDVLLAS